MEEASREERRQVISESGGGRGQKLNRFDHAEKSVKKLQVAGDSEKAD